MIRQHQAFEDDSDGPVGGGLKGLKGAYFSPVHFIDEQMQLLIIRLGGHEKPVMAVT